MITTRFLDDIKNALSEVMGFEVNALVIEENNYVEETSPVTQPETKEYTKSKSIFDEYTFDGKKKVINVNKTVKTINNLLNLLSFFKQSPLII